jgi:hypothetical protein
LVERQTNPRKIISSIDVKTRGATSSNLKKPASRDGGHAYGGAEEPISKPKAEIPTNVFVTNSPKTVQNRHAIPGRTYDRWAAAAFIRAERFLGRIRSLAGPSSPTLMRKPGKERSWLVLADDFASGLEPPAAGVSP